MSQSKFHHFHFSRFFSLKKAPVPTTQTLPTDKYTQKVDISLQVVNLSCSGYTLWESPEVSFFFFFFFF